MRAGRETLLLVEDEEEVRALAREVLQLEGYTVLEAGSAAEALRVSEQHAGPIQLLLTDVVLPRMGGPELARRLGTGRPELRTLFMSGHIDATVVEHGGAAPGAAFLAKPFMPDGLVRKVREMLDRPVGREQGPR